MTRKPIVGQSRLYEAVFEWIRFFKDNFCPFPLFRVISPLGKKLKRGWAGSNTQNGVTLFQVPVRLEFNALVQ